MRLAKPVRQHAVFGDTVEHSIGADDGGIARSGKNQHAHKHHEGMKQQPQGLRPGEVHGQAANQVLQEIRPLTVRNNHHGEQRNHAGE